MPNYGGVCSTENCDNPRYINVNHIGSLCRLCYDVWWQDEVLPDIRRKQSEFSQLREQNYIASLRNYDQSVAHLPKSERRQIFDVQLPDWSADEHSTATGPEPDIRRASPPARPLPQSTQ